MSATTIDRAIKNWKYFRQQVLFAGTGFCGNKFTPTDIDAVLDLKNNLWVFVEAKFRGSEFPVGQRLLFEHMLENLSKARVHGLALQVEHDAGKDKDIMLADCTVKRYLTTQAFKGERPREWYDTEEEKWFETTDSGIIRFQNFVEFYMWNSMGQSHEFRDDLENDTYDFRKWDAETMTYLSANINKRN